MYANTSHSFSCSFQPNKFTFQTAFSFFDGPKQCHYIESEQRWPNHLYPEDSMNLEIVQNFMEVDVSKTDAVAFDDEEDEKLDW